MSVFHDDDAYDLHSQHPTNYTSTVTVKIRVTPLKDHFTSWGILFVGFFVASVVAAWQVVRERRIKNPSPRHDEERVDAEVPPFSSADVTRSLFRRLLLVALVTRLCVMPIQIWTYPMWWQFVGDSLPEMVFATAWSILVTFFVQLVGILTGAGGSDTRPGMVMQTITWVVYSILIVVEYFNTGASVLLYTLLGGIYTTLLGFVVYSLPRLFLLMRPQHQREFGVRLLLCSVTCCLVFGGHAVGYGRLVIAPPEKIYWWIRYGCLELLPAFAFLVIMRPRAEGGVNRRDDTPEPRDYRQPSLRRVDSGSQRLDSRRTADSSRGSYGAIE